MIVIHPYDPSTAVLTRLYEGLNPRVLLTHGYSRAALNHLFYHAPSGERLMLLGHGCPDGLYRLSDGVTEGLYDIVVGHSLSHSLRRHGADTIGIWCYADRFAQREGLHGLFSGMIISEKSEADALGVEASAEEIRVSNERMFRTLRRYLDEAVPLGDIPSLIRMADDEHTALSHFNYGNFHYL